MTVLGARRGANCRMSAYALATLADFDCDIAQGYHVARPMTSDAFDTWRAERERRAADGAFVQAGTS